MTCIVGIVDKSNNKTYLAADSIGIRGDDRSIQNNPKIFRNYSNYKFVIGFSGSFRMGQILQYELKPPDVKNIHESSYDEMMRYMVQYFIPEVRETFKSHGFIQSFAEGDEKGGNFIVAYKKYMFVVEADFFVSSAVDNYIAIGCGAVNALGALYVLNNDGNISYKNKLFKALYAAKYHSICVEEPFIFLETN